MKAYKGPRGMIARLTIRIERRQEKLLRHWAHLDGKTRGDVIRELIEREDVRRGHELASLSGDHA